MRHFRLQKNQCDEVSFKDKLGFIQTVFQLHLEHMPDVYSLDDLSELLGMSPSTFKRKLAKHKYTFQRLQDMARLSVSLKLIQQNGFKNIDLANYLEIKDVNNFRRAFKRWCGMTPAAIKERLV